MSTSWSLRQPGTGAVALDRVKESRDPIQATWHASSSSTTFIRTRKFHPISPGYSNRA